MERKWAREPIVKIDDGNGKRALGADGELAIVADFLSPETYDRLIDCYNACAPIDNPGETIPKMIELIKALNCGCNVPDDCEACQTLNCTDKLAIEILRGIKE